MAKDITTLFMNKINKFRILILLSAVFYNFSIHAGVIQLTGTNITTSGLNYSTSGSGTFNYDATGFWATGSTVFWTIGSYNIRNGQSWSNIKVVMTGAGSLDFYIYSENQSVIYSKTGATSTFTVDLTALPELVDGAPFYIKISLGISAVASITSITATYAGNHLVCYPSPYQISTGQMKMVFDVNTSSTVTLEIYDNRGRLVKTLFTEKAISAASSRFDNIYTWDGKDDNGRVINTGIYMAVVRVNPVDTTKTAEKYISTFRILVVR